MRRIRAALRPWALASTVILAAAACVENEEVIEVRADGSVVVTVRAESDRPEDFTDGYSIPLHEPFIPVGTTTEAWIATVGPDTGSAALRSRGDAATDRLPGGDRDLELSSRAVFESVEDWPEFYAPPGEPYRTAYLRRSADLTIEKRGGKTVYVFERTFHRRAQARPVWIDIAERIPEEIGERIEDGAETPLDMAKLTRIVREAHGALTRSLVRDALEGIYTRGDASLPLAAHSRIVTSVGDAMSRYFDGVSLDELLAATRRYDELEKTGAAPEEHPLTTFETEFRDRVRSAFTLALEAEKAIVPRIRNAVLERLEWSFTSMDATSDLGDESFQVAVAMPGTIVAGNYDGIDGRGRTLWRFGNDFVDTDVRMRVVSVLE